MSTIVSVNDTAETAMYARFTRRVQAVYIDLIIFIVIAVVALLIGVNVESDNARRALGAAFFLSWFLYEPLFVSLTGGTLGHRYCNIRVVDARDGGNIGSFRAFFRSLIKGFLSWYSFVVMAATSRHQALHDVITRSAVQIRDAAKAKPHHYVGARAPLPAGTPSRTRRILVIAAYLTVYVCLMGFAEIGMFKVGPISSLCSQSYSACSAAVHWIDIGFGLSLVAGVAFVIGFGWRGKLLGARTASPSPMIKSTT